MDWALVLASQGIDAAIDDGTDGAGWALVVSTSDYPAAVQAIRQYRLENRHWHWRQPLRMEGLVFDWRVMLWAALMALFYWLSHVRNPGLEATGCMDNAAVQAGEWWRLFTAMLLHADMAHLTANVSFGVVLLGLAMGRYGGGVGLLAAYLAGVVGNVAGLLFYPPSHQSLGASGMVMGGLGLLAAQSVAHLGRHPITRRHVIRGVLGGVMLFVLLGFGPGTDVLAHLGGFLTGLLFGAVLTRLPAGWQRPWTDIAAWLVFGGLIFATCWQWLRF